LPRNRFVRALARVNGAVTDIRKYSAAIAFHVRMRARGIVSEYDDLAFFFPRILFHECVAGFRMSSVSVIVPALNEEKPIAGVVRFNHVGSFIVNANHSMM
jgi:hypothetical protein